MQSEIYFWTSRNAKFENLGVSECLLEDVKVSRKACNCWVSEMASVGPAEGPFWLRWVLRSLRRLYKNYNSCANCIIFQNYNFCEVWAMLSRSETDQPAIVVQISANALCICKEFLVKPSPTVKLARRGFVFGFLLRFSQNNCYTLVCLSYDINSTCAGKPWPWRIQRCVKLYFPTLWGRHGGFWSRCMAQNLGPLPFARFEILGHLATWN